MGTRHSLASQSSQNNMLQVQGETLAQKIYLERNKRVKVNVALASTHIHSQVHSYTRTHLQRQKLPDMGYTCVTLALRRLRQEDYKFKARMGYRARSHDKIKS